MRFENIFDEPPKKKEKEELVEVSEETWDPPEVLKKEVQAQLETPKEETVQVYWQPCVITVKFRLVGVEDIEDSKVRLEWIYEGKNRFSLDTPIYKIKTSRDIHLMIGRFFELDIGIKRDGSMRLEGLREIV